MILGNDLFLIIDTQDELINRLSGLYSNLSFREHSKGDKADLSRILASRNRLSELGNLKNELAGKDIEHKKKIIRELSNEIKTISSVII